MRRWSQILKSNQMYEESSVYFIFAKCHGGSGPKVRISTWEIKKTSEVDAPDQDVSLPVYPMIGI